MREFTVIVLRQEEHYLYFLPGRYLLPRISILTILSLQQAVTDLAKPLRRVGGGPLEAREHKLLDPALIQCRDPSLGLCPPQIDTYCTH